MDVKELAQKIARKGKDCDELMRDPNIPSELRFYFVGVLLAELSRLTDPILAPENAND